MTRRTAAWVAWALRMLVYEWPARLMICPTEAVAHDTHHRKPKDRDWANHIWNRQAELAAGRPSWGIPYTEVWSLHNGINECFRTLTLADRRAFGLDADMGVTSSSNETLRDHHED